MEAEGALAEVLNAVFFMLAVGLVNIALARLLEELVGDPGVRTALLVGLGPWVTDMVRSAVEQQPQQQAGGEHDVV